jgi:hypothetical protein
VAYTNETRKALTVSPPLLLQQSKRPLPETGQRQQKVDDEQARLLTKHA